MGYISAIPNRGILKITGKDRASFLQGLVTNDVGKVSLEQTIYAALLSPQGKFQFDFFIVAHINTTGEEEWFLECGGDRAEDLLKRLSLYKLRCDVTIENVSDDFTVWALWDLDLNPLNLLPQPGLTQPFEEGILFVDPRLADLGSRVIAPKNNPQDFYKRWELTLSPWVAYNYHRLTLGVPNSQDILVDRGVLLECGLDELNAIDWRKGCYMGQELTARTRYRGLVRKRLIPVHIEGKPPLFQTPILQGTQDVGNMRTTEQDQGIAMIRLNALSNPLPFSCGNATVVPHIPHWMRLPSEKNEG